MSEELYREEMIRINRDVFGPLGHDFRDGDLCYGEVFFANDGGRTGDDGLHRGKVLGQFTPVEGGQAFDVVIADPTRLLVRLGVPIYCAAIKPSAMRGNTSLAWPMFEHMWLVEEGQVLGEVVDRSFLYVAFVRQGNAWIGDFHGTEVLWRGPENEDPYYKDEIEAGAVSNREQVPVMFRVAHPGRIYATVRASQQMVDRGEFKTGEVKIDKSKAEALICPLGSIEARTGTFMDCWQMFGLDSEPDKTSSNMVDARARVLSRTRNPGADDPVFQMMIQAGFPGDPSSDKGREERLQVIEDARRELVMTGLTKYNNQVWITQPDGGRVKVYVLALVDKKMNAGKAEVAELFDAALAITSEHLQADHATDTAFRAMRDAGWSGDPSSSDGRRVRKALLRAARPIAIKLALGEDEFLFSIGDGVPERFKALTVLGLTDDADTDAILAKLDLMLSVNFGQLNRKDDTGYKAVRKAHWKGHVHPGIMGFRATVLIKAAKCLVDSEQVNQLVGRIQEARVKVEPATDEGSDAPAPRKRGRRRKRAPRQATAKAPESGAKTEGEASEQPADEAGGEEAETAEESEAEPSNGSSGPVIVATEPAEAPSDEPEADEDGEVEDTQELGDDT